MSLSGQKGAGPKGALSNGSLILQRFVYSTVYKSLVVVCTRQLQVTQMILDDPCIVNELLIIKVCYRNIIIKKQFLSVFVSVLSKFCDLGEIGHSKNSSGKK